VPKRGAQQVARGAPSCAARRRLARDEERDGLERVEQEVRLQARPERRELRACELGLQARGRPLALALPALRSTAASSATIAQYCRISTGSSRATCRAAALAKAARCIAPSSRTDHVMAALTPRGRRDRRKATSARAMDASRRHEPRDSAASGTHAR
jgi:hypothetical protein